MSASNKHPFLTPTSNGFKAGHTSIRGFYKQQRERRSRVAEQLSHFLKPAYNQPSIESAFATALSKLANEGTLAPDQKKQNQAKAAQLTRLDKARQAKVDFLADHIAAHGKDGLSGSSLEIVQTFEDRV